MIASRRFTSVAALAAACLFLATFAALHRGWYDDEEIVDIPVYETYGNAIERGSIPYRDFRLEYPPAALPMFVLPALLSDRGGPARRSGGRSSGRWLAAAASRFSARACILAALGATRTRVVATLAAIAVFPLLLGSVVLTRFDLWPIALVLARARGAALGAQPARLRDSRARRRGEALPGGARAARALVRLAAAWPPRGAHLPRRARPAWSRSSSCRSSSSAPDGVAYSLGRQLGRPLQIESLGSSFLLAAHHLFGLGLEMRSSHGSQNLDGTLPAILATLLTAVQLGVLTWIWLRRPATARSSCAGALRRSSPSSRSGRCSRRSS